MSFRMSTTFSSSSLNSSTRLTSARLGSPPDMSTSSGVNSSNIIVILEPEPDNEDCLRMWCAFCDVGERANADCAAAPVSGSDAAAGASDVKFEHCSRVQWHCRQCSLTFIRETSYQQHSRLHQMISQELEERKLTNSGVGQQQARTSTPIDCITLDFDEGNYGEDDDGGGGVASSSSSSAAKRGRISIFDAQLSPISNMSPMATTTSVPVIATQMTPNSSLLSCNDRRERIGVPAGPQSRPPIHPIQVAQNFSGNQIATHVPSRIRVRQTRTSAQVRGQAPEMVRIDQLPMVRNNSGWTGEGGGDGYQHQSRYRVIYDPAERLRNFLSGQPCARCGLQHLQNCQNGAGNEGFNHHHHLQQQIYPTAPMRSSFASSQLEPIGQAALAATNSYYHPNQEGQQVRNAPYFRHN